MKKSTNWLFAVASGLLLWAAWPVSPFTLLIFVAWIPLLWIETQVKSRRTFFALTYLTTFTWNVATTWWVWNASEPGAVAAFVANSFLMCFPWLGFKIAKKWLGEKAGYVSLIAFWLCFEYIHLQDWGLSWPWLTIGNVFASHPQWVQWYEYTGTSGGSLWVMIVNVLLFLHIRNNINRTEAKSYKNLMAAILILILPVTISILIPAYKSGPANRKNVLVVQPNIDPYEKISAGTIEAQLQKLIETSEKEIDQNTALVIWPETAVYVEGGIEETKMKQNFFLNPLWNFLRRHPNITLFTGVESYREYDNKQTTTAKPLGNSHFYDGYNGSVLLDSTGALAFYHKSKLVPGVETLPWFLKFIDSWFEKFGGTTAGYTTQKERTVLNDAKHGYKIAPAICFESIYGEFMTEYVRNGANVICTITNDGWWRNTPGHKQHMNYARLRAIETRTWVARSANTGISCFIDPNGVVIEPRQYNTIAAIKFNIPVSNDKSKTFYVQYGDLISKGITIAAIAFIIMSFIKWIKRKSA
ncbi:MAG: apolipoprotein N-acyltransferase [Chitinophagaceae bacterium]